MVRRPPTFDEMEDRIRKALLATDIVFQDDHGTGSLPGSNPSRLDFGLPELGIDIEVKRFHTDRIAEQMSRVPNVIAIQGLPAARFFAMLLECYRMVTEVQRRETTNEE